MWLGPDVVVPVAAFVIAGGTCLALTQRRGAAMRLQSRLRQLAGPGESEPQRMTKLARQALPAVGLPLLPSNSVQRTQLRNRLLHAGLYNRHALPVFLGVKFLLIFAPWLVGLAAGLSGLVSLKVAVTVGAMVGGLGLIAPGFWLDGRKAKRQRRLRRGLPDVFDLLVLCVESGLSFLAALRRVGVAIVSAHPLLGIELDIVLREVQLGQSLAEALGRMAERTDLEEIDALAKLIEQTERLGGGVVKPLRIQSEMLRFKQVQEGQARAQKAGAKILIPTLLFIFPGVFYVILGPGAIQVYELMGQRKAKMLAPQEQETRTRDDSSGSDHRSSD